MRLGRTPNPEAMACRLRACSTFRRRVARRGAATGRAPPMSSAIQSLLAGIFGRRPAPDGELGQALTRAIETVEPKLRTVGGFEQRLAPAVRAALDYSQSLVARIPGPLELSRPAFSSDPMVHALFATAPDIDRMLGTSQAVRDFLREPDSFGPRHFYALFAARRVEKRQLGMAMQGEVIRSDVPQTVIYFSDHTLSEPAADLGGLQGQLRMVFFDSLLKSFAAHVGALRAEREDARAGLSVERAHLTVLRYKHDGREQAVHTRRIEELDAHLRDLGSELAPSGMIGTLGRFLSQPESAIRLEPYSVTVDRLGVIVDSPESGESGLATLHFPEMVARDRRRYLVMLAKIDVAEAREAVERAAEAQRRFVLI